MNQVAVYDESVWAFPEQLYSHRVGKSPEDLACELKNRYPNSIYFFLEDPFAEKPIVLKDDVHVFVHTEYSECSIVVDGKLNAEEFAQEEAERRKDHAIYFFMVETTDVEAV